MGKNSLLCVEPYCRTTATIKGKFCSFHEKMHNANQNEKVRICLTCNNNFRSNHIGNRICKFCKNTDSYNFALTLHGTTNQQKTGKE